jgi:hypothetical protein
MRAGALRPGAGGGEPRHHPGRAAGAGFVEGPDPQVNRDHAQSFPPNPATI